MVSLFSPSTSIHIPRLHFTFNPNFLFHHVNLSLFKLRPPRQSNHFSVNSVEKGPSLRIRNEQQQPQPRPRTLFPSGYKRPEIKVPSLVLQLSAEEVMNEKSTLDLVDKALSNGSFGIVVLDGGEGSSGKLLYEAACLLKSVIRERAYLMISERVDIASAVNASGVVLADQGLPTLVARNMMMVSQSESIFFPLVARKVQTSNAALNTSNLEGADFLISGVDGEKLPDELGNTIFRSVRIPNFILIDSPVEERLHKDAQMLLKSGTSGLVVSLKDWKLFTDDYFSKLLYAGYASDKSIHEKIESPATLGRDNGFPGKKGVTGFIKLQDREVQLLEKERLILLEAKEVIQRAAPLMEEVSLLSDAVSQLDEPFSLVIVGEFNSGKSTVINALLGKKYLKDGVVPTTNEITFLRYAEFNSSEQKRCERHPDGQYTCYLPAPMLKEMVIVDTPGTNVILQRQQRLTEEFLPRADLLIFVMSADRPLSESEVSFLRYTQQWKKKVVFVLNKSDLYQNASELEEAIAFIKENAQKLLNTERVILYHLSARSALESKLSAASDISTDHEVCMKNSYSTGSFDEFEKFLFSFLDGSTSMGIERMTLKLETPVHIAEQLLCSCGKLVSEEYQHAKRDLKLVNELVSSVKEYTFKMETESLSWRRQILSLIDTTQARIMKLIESTLLLSNLDLVTSYAFKGGKSTSMPAALSIKNDIIGPSLSEAQKVLGEFVTWLESNNGREGRLYRESFEKRWPSIDAHNLDQLKIDAILGRRHELSKKVVENFSASAASTLFEQEIREVLLGTFGGLGVAGLSASLLTSVLPTTLEDLLALGLCSAGGLLVISNFPARRQQLVEKVKRTVSAFAHELEEEMQKDVLETVDDLDNFVKLIGKPYQEQALVRLHKLSETQEELTNIEKKLKELHIEIHNLHILLS